MGTVSISLGSGKYVYAIYERITKTDFDERSITKQHQESVHFFICKKKKMESSCHHSVDVFI